MLYVISISFNTLLNTYTILIYLKKYCQELFLFVLYNISHNASDIYKI